MSNWRSESVLVTRYLGSGALNTIVSFTIIFSAMAVGISPMVSNIAGYVVGFTMGFVLSKKFVFRSNGHLVVESVRYLIAFILSFLFNLVVLHSALTYFNFHVVPSQLAATGSYTLLMYALTRLFVFGATIMESQR